MTDQPQDPTEPIVDTSESPPLAPSAADIPTEPAAEPVHDLSTHAGLLEYAKRDLDAFVQDLLDAAHGVSLDDLDALPKGSRVERLDDGLLLTLPAGQQYHHATARGLVETWRGEH